MHTDATLALVAQMEKVSRLCRTYIPAEKHTAMLPLMALLAMRCSEGITRVCMTDVSRELMMSKPAATQAVQKLVDAGILRRVRDADGDRRVIYIEMTEYGMRKFNETTERRLDFTDRAVERMGADRVMQLNGLLSDFIDAMYAEAEERACCQN